MTKAVALLALSVLAIINSFFIMIVGWGMHMNNVFALILGYGISYALTEMFRAVMKDK